MERYFASVGFDIILSVILMRVWIAVNASCFGADLNDCIAADIDTLPVVDGELTVEPKVDPILLLRLSVRADDVLELLRDNNTVLPAVIFWETNESVSDFKTLPKKIKRCNDLGHLSSYCITSIKSPTVPLEGTCNCNGLLSPLYDKDHCI